MAVSRRFPSACTDTARYDPDKLFERSAFIPRDGRVFFTWMASGIPERLFGLSRGRPPTSVRNTTFQEASVLLPVCRHAGEKFPLLDALTIGIMYTRIEQLIHPEEVAMQVGDVLRKKAARVATVRMNETVAIAAQLMRSSNISALVVKDVVRTEGNTAVGMFTERDVVRAIAEYGAAGVNMRVSQFISVQQLVSCTSTDTLEHVRHLMSKHHIRHVPVIDNYSLIGVISIRDISIAFDDEATPLKLAASA
jgi:CBS domain-containing protein